MRFQSCLFAAAASSPVVLLLGCGSSDHGDSGSSTTTGSTGRTTTRTTATTTTLPKRSENMTQPLSVGEVLAKLNRNFRGYNAEDVTSPIGVPITWLKDGDEKMKLYCPDVVGNDWGGCFDGSATCRMSTVLHNHEMPVVNGRFYTFSGRSAGVVFNVELAERYFGKCAYPFDGGSNNRYNFGCGNGAVGDVVNCNSTNSPMNDICPSTNKTCTADDAEVSYAECDRIGGHASINSWACMYKGVAYNISKGDISTHYTGERMWSSPSQIRTMVDDRFSLQQQRDCGDQCWNELILDERLLLTQLWWDPATAVDAIVYFRGDSSARGHATLLQQSFASDWGVTPPLIAVDKDCDVSTDACAPFYAPDADMGLIA